MDQLDSIYMYRQEMRPANISAVAKSSFFTYDSLPPRVLSVRGVSNNSNTSYGKEGDTITLTVSFSELVRASGAPQLDLGNARRADCPSSNCLTSQFHLKKDLVFNYQVVATDNGGLKLERFLFDSGEKIMDNAENSVVQPSTPITVSGVTLDTTSPSVTSLAATNSSNIWSWSWDCSEANCQYRHKISTSSTAPTLTESYSSTKTATPPSGTDGTYHVHVQVKDAAGNESAVVTSATDHTLSVGGTPVVKTLSGPAAKTYGLGESLDFQVLFDRSVIVTGTPQLPLRIGAQDRYASYSSGSNSNTLTFRYVTVAGDVDSDGVEVKSGSINLNGGGLNGSTSVSLVAKTFATVLVDTLPPLVTITSTHTDDITASNALNYQVSGTCNKVGLAVKVRVGTLAPASASTCLEAKTWAATLNLGALPKGDTTITASQTNSIGTGSATPVDVTVGNFEQVVRSVERLSVGEEHACVVRFDGKVSCWGNNGHGQLGNNSTTHANYPVTVRDETGGAGTSLENIVQVSAGYGHTCALNTEGKVLCWGSGTYGRMGDNGYAYNYKRLYPGFVKGINNSGTLGEVVQLSAGLYHTCAVASNGMLSCWGANDKGQLGRRYAQYNENYHPRFVRSGQNAPPLEGIIEVDSGVGHTCALTSENKVFCWGQMSSGALGNGVDSGDYTRDPILVLDSSGTAGSTFGDVIQIVAGQGKSCTLKADNTVYCWGNDSGGTHGAHANSLHPVLESVSHVRALSQFYSHGG